MDHHEVDKGGNSDHLSCKALVCARGIGVSFGGPLQGCPWMVTLRKKAREESCKHKMGEVFSNFGQKLNFA
jgi:hypothetical protein